MLHRPKEKRLRLELPSVDFVVGPQSYHKLPEMLENTMNLLLVMNLLKMRNLKIYFIIHAGGVSEFVSIQEGCDKFCSFCVVPYTRGPEFSRPISEILMEIEKVCRSRC